MVPITRYRVMHTTLFVYVRRTLVSFGIEERPSRYPRSIYWLVYTYISLCCNSPGYPSLYPSGKQRAERPITFGSALNNLFFFPFSWSNHRALKNDHTPPAVRSQRSLCYMYRQMLGYCCLCTPLPPFLSLSLSLLSHLPALSADLCPSSRTDDVRLTKRRRTR